MSTTDIMAQSDSSIDSDSNWSYDEGEEFRLAQKEWEQSIGELQELALVLLLPWVGRYFGRRTSHWLWHRYLRVGLGKSFFLPGNAVAWLSFP